LSFPWCYVLRIEALPIKYRGRAQSCARPVTPGTLNSAHVATTKLPFIPDHRLLRRGVDFVGALPSFTGFAGSDAE